MNSKDIISDTINRYASFNPAKEAAIELYVSGITVREYFLGIKNILDAPMPFLISVGNHLSDIERR